jgi:Cd2+/Zn2+-exporting ATPase
VGLFPRAARNLLRLHLDIDVLMGLAILGAMALGQWDEAATVAFLYGLSEALEALSLDRARRSIRALLDLAPPTAERIGPDGTIQVVPAGQVHRGDRLLVRAGDTIPVDGAVASGDRASTRRRSRASRSRWCASRATRSTPARSTARGRWRSWPPGPWATR